MYYWGNVIVIYIKAGDECFCGNKLGKKKSDSECKTPCTGDKEQVCGGSWRLAVYKNTKFVPRELLSFKQGDKVTLTKTFLINKKVWLHFELFYTEPIGFNFM